METESKITLSENDFQKLSSLLGGTDVETAGRLADELNRASVVPSGQLPADVVSMHSTVRFVDLASEKESTVILVFPHEAKIEDDRISVLTPVGSALIGLRAGHSIRWPMPNGKEKILKVVSVEQSRN